MTTGYPEALRAPGRYADIPEDTDSDPLREHISSVVGDPGTPNLGSKRTRNGKTYYVENTIMGKAGYTEPFYYNGPTQAAWLQSMTHYNQRQGALATWSDPSKAAVLDQYSRLVDKYGHTNSAGVLWALAQSGLDTDADAIQQMLKTDATAMQSEYSAGMPAQGGSPNSQEALGEDQGGGFLDAIMPDNIWEPFQAAGRNTFAALNMPLQAIQGAQRGAGGGIAQALEAAGTGDTAGIIEGGKKAALSIASIANPVLGAVGDGLLVPDDVFENPWEQTDMGQTLLAARSGAGWWDWSAFGKQQAAPDTTKAADLLENDPRFSEQRKKVISDPSQRNQVLLDIAEQEHAQGDPGWFIEENSPIGEAQRQATYRSWAIPGPEDQMVSWTMGRGLTGWAIGPDRTGYSFASGLVDAIATITQDPLTFAPAIGLPSKIARGIGKGIEAVAPNAAKGAEQALTFGMEGRKARGSRGLLNRNNDELLRQYNTLADDPIGPLSGKHITADEVATMGMEQRALLLRQVKEAEASGKALSAATPNAEDITAPMRELRRSQAQETRWGAQAGEQENRVVTLLTQARDASKKAKPGEDGSRFSERNYNRWFASLSDDDKALWGKHFPKMADRFHSLKKQPDGDWWDNLIDHATGGVQRADARAGSKTPKSAYTGNVNADAARLTIDNAANDGGAALQGIDTAGVTVQAALEPGVVQRGIIDTVDSAVVWTGAKPAVLQDAALVMPLAQRQALAQKLKTVLDTEKRDPINLPPGQEDALPGEVARYIDENEDAWTKVADILDSPAPSYGHILGVLSKVGLDGYLDDFLRTQGVDGLSGVTRETRTGVWYGDHPNIEAYAWPADAADNAAIVGGILDEADKAAYLDSIPVTAQRIGIRATSPEQARVGARMQADITTTLRGRRESQIAAWMAKANGAQVGLDREMGNITAKFADVNNIIRTMLTHEVGQGVSPGLGNSLDAKAARWFLYGVGPMAAYRRRAFAALGDFVKPADKKLFDGLTPGTPEWAAARKGIENDYLGLLQQVTSGKWSHATYNAVLDNALKGGGEDGLVRALAPRLGLDVEQGSLNSLRSSMKDGQHLVESFRTSNSHMKRTIARLTSERPGSRTVDINSGRDVADAIVKYGVYAKVPNATIRGLVGQVIANDGKFGANSVNVDALKGIFNAVNKELVGRLHKDSVLYGGDSGAERISELEQAINESTRLFFTGHFVKQDVAGRIGNDGSVARIIGDDGTSVELPHEQLDSELLHGTISMPGVDEWSMMMNRVAKGIARLPKVQHTYDIARSIYDNFFRTSLLVFRASYILRNSAEMQIRMYLNGHHSIFNDPMTLAGMVISGRSPNNSFKKLLKVDGPYADTILGDSFATGGDEALAFANHTEQYNALIWLANSLTDPRVYNNSISKGWRMVGPTEPSWTAGWANELLMQHNTPITRAVLGKLPGDYKPTTVGAGIEDTVTDWLLSDTPTAMRIRAEMTGASKNYETIFGSRSMTKDYLFENENSVLNRVRRFTMNDPILEEFVKEGVWRGGGATWQVRSVSDLAGRVTGLQRHLRDQFYDNGVMKEATANYLQTARATVPWIDAKSLQKGKGWVDGFFRFANKLERLGSVGPEFRMAYWDRLAELAPALSIEDVPRALESARTTLSTIRQLAGPGKYEMVGRNHPAFAALDKASKENTGGLMRIDELHQAAMDHAAEHVKELFYDAARRNEFWSATRLIFPFGQAWGNTIRMWTKLGMERPIQVYKAARVFNAAQQTGSQAIYDAGEGTLLGQYPDGQAPWEQDPNGGFIFTDPATQQASFMLPLIGRAQGLGVNVLSALNGIDARVNTIDQTSPMQSANLALGADSILPGTSPMAGMVLDAMPDWKIVDDLRRVTNPFGDRDALASVFAPWIGSAVGGVGAIPGVGDTLSDWLSSLAPSVKNKNTRDAQAILAASGDYDMKDPDSVRRLREDTADLARSMLLVTAIAKNISPTSPQAVNSLDLSTDGSQGALEEPGTVNALGLFSQTYPLYLEEAGGDEAAAKEAMLRDYGPSAVFALTGNRSGYTRQPSSQARDWALQSESNLNVAKTYIDYFPLFFPKGDSSDVITRMWMDDLTERTSPYRTAEEMTDANLAAMARVRKSRIDFFETSGAVSKDQAQQMRDDLEDEFAQTETGQQFNSMTTGKQITQINGMLDAGPSLRTMPAGKAWAEAMAYRDEALAEARSRSGQDNTTLSGKKVTSLKNAYLNDLKGVYARYPDFQLLYGMLSREFD